jgi:hypothetical protein
MALFRKEGTSIDKLKYSFDNGARANRFDVGVFCPKLGFSLEGIRVESCSLPGRQITTTAFSEYGMPRNLPTGVIKNDEGTTDMTFVCDASFADRFIIEAWMQSIFSADVIGSGDGQINKSLRKERLKKVTERSVDSTFNVADEQGATRGASQGGTSIHPVMNYYYDYVGEVKIAQLYGDDTESLVYTLHEAYPIGFAAMALSQSSAELLKFTVTFAYRTWESEYKKAPRLSLLNKGRKVLDALRETAEVAGNVGIKSGGFVKRLNKLDDYASKLNRTFGGNG